MKLIELENKLKEETKLRNKAEKRLKLLRKKLESLTTLPSLEELEKSSAVSCVSSSGSSGTNKDPEKSASKSQISVPETPKNVEENASDTTTSIEEKSSGKSSSSQEDPKTDDDITSSSSLKASTVEIDHMSGRSVNYEDDDDGGDDHVDNSLALVPMKLPETKKLGPDEIKIVSKSIGEVLDTLRHARERIQSSMERRQMIRVGPS
ncbi:hypothetical protein PTKIN_Ptkin06aG0032300 [Pterospermum kingtungense]